MDRRAVGIETAARKIRNAGSAKRLEPAALAASAGSAHFNGGICERGLKRERRSTISGNVKKNRRTA